MESCRHKKSNDALKLYMDRKHHHRHPLCHWLLHVQYFYDETSFCRFTTTLTQFKMKFEISLLLFFIWRYLLKLQLIQISFFSRAGFSFLFSHTFKQVKWNDIVNIFEEERSFYTTFSYSSSAKGLYIYIYIYDE